MPSDPLKPSAPADIHYLPLIRRRTDIGSSDDDLWSETDTETVEAHNALCARLEREEAARKREKNKKGISSLEFTTAS